MKKLMVSMLGLTLGLGTAARVMADQGSTYDQGQTGTHEQGQTGTPAPGETGTPAPGQAATPAPGMHEQGQAGENEQKGEPVDVSALPAPVKATFDKESKGGTLEEVRKDTNKDGKVVYRGEVMKKGKGTELEVAESGKVLHRGKAHSEKNEKGEKNEKSEKGEQK